MSRPVLIIGSRGQDGRLLAERLHSKGKPVIGLHRKGVTMPDGTEKTGISLTNRSDMTDLVHATRPAQIHYLAAYHHASDEARPDEVELRQLSEEVHVAGLEYVMDAAREHAPDAHLFHAGSSHMFAGVEQNDPVDEQTPFASNGVYADTKIMACEMIRHARQQGFFGLTGFLFNHESPLREPRFVSRMIAQAAVSARNGARDPLQLRDPSARTDWSHAKDFVRGFDLALHLSDPHDLVFASGKLHSVRQMMAIAFDEAGLNWCDWLAPHQAPQQPARALVGNPARLRKLTGWEPQYTFEAMVREMVQAEMDRA